MKISLYMLCVLLNFSVFSTIINAQKNIIYTGDTIDIVTKVDHMYEIILPEPFIEFKTNIEASKKRDYFLMSAIDGQKHIFIKFKRDDLPIKLYFVGAFSNNTYVLNADFISDDDDDIYRIIADINDKELENSKREKTLAKMSYEDKAMIFAKDVISGLYDSNYTIKRNINIPVLEQVPSFNFILKKSYMSKDFIAMKIKVTNPLSVAQPFNIDKFYIPGMIMASIDNNILQKRPKTAAQFFKKNYETNLYIIFDKNVKSFRERVYGVKNK